MTESEFLDADILASSLHIAKTIGESLSAISRLNTREHRLTGMKASLLPWSTLNYPLNQLSTEHVKIVLGVCPAVISVEKLTQALGETAPLSTLLPLSQDKDQHYLLLLYHHADAEATEDVLKSFAFSTTQFKGLSGTPAEEIVRIEKELDEVSVQRAEEEKKIASFADSRAAIQHCLDRLEQDLAREAAREHLLTDGTIVFLEGWAAATGLERLERELDSFTCAYTLDEPMREETPPTLLKNPKWMSCINMVTEMYSLPAYHDGIDPNPLMFFFYIAFFGFMFADIAYGIILSIACAIIIKKYRPKNTLGYMFHLGVYLGITTTIFGFVTGSFFGDAITVFSKTFLGMEGVALPNLISPLGRPNVLRSMYTHLHEDP
jgi:V/A-type H+-transporting ATPase subunit I